MMSSQRYLTGTIHGNLETLITGVPEPKCVTETVVSLTVTMRPNFDEAWFLKAFVAGSLHYIYSRGNVINAIEDKESTTSTTKKLIATFDNWHFAIPCNEHPPRCFSFHHSFNTHVMPASPFFSIGLVKNSLVFNGGVVNHVEGSQLERIGYTLTAEWGEHPLHTPVWDAVKHYKPMATTPVGSMRSPNHKPSSSSVFRY